MRLVLLFLCTLVAPIIASGLRRWFFIAHGFPAPRRLANFRRFCFLYLANPCSSTVLVPQQDAPRCAKKNNKRARGSARGDSYCVFFRCLEGLSSVHVYIPSVWVGPIHCTRSHPAARPQKAKCCFPSINMIVGMLFLLASTVQAPPAIVSDSSLSLFWVWIGIAITLASSRSFTADACAPR